MSSISPSPASSIPILPSPPFSGSPPPASRTSPPSPSNSTAPPSLPTPSPSPPSPPSSSPPTSDAPPPNIAPPPDLSVSVPPPVPMATPPMVTSNRTENPPPPPNVPSASPVMPNATASPPPSVPSDPPPPPNLPLAPAPRPPPNVPDSPPPTSDPSPPPPSPPPIPEVPSVPPPRSSSNTTSPPPPTPLISPPPPPNATQPTPSNSPPPPMATPPDNSPPPPPSATPPEASPPPPPQPMPPNNSPPPPPSTTPPRATPPENSPPPVMPPEALPSPPVPPGPLPPSPPAPIRSPSSPGNETGPNPPSSITPTPLAPSPPSNSSGGGFSNPAPVPTIPTPGRQPPAESGGGGIPTGGRVAIGVGVALILLSLIGLVIWCLRKQKRKGARQNGGYVVPSYDPSESPDLKSQSPVPYLASDSSGVNSPALGSSRSWFTYQELEEITNGFSSENLLGEGGFGPVYKGCLADGREVAVKQLKIGGGQGEREFRAEVDIISRIHHRHLVSLVGYCISDNQRLLVYDYVPNNTLHYHLHGKDRPVMDWKTRSRIAAGAARGIAYLHEDCHPRIIHRDIKSSNILLDNNFEAQVSDFGLAKLALDGSTHVSTRVVGTFGYMAPEYARSGKLTDKSDVFSFGVVLLELITGRKPVDTSLPLGDESLVEWARPLLSHAIDKREFEGLVDPRLENNYDQPEMFRMIEAAATCVRHSAEKRPRMGQVMRVLDSLGYSSSLNNGTAPGSSEAFNTAEHSFMRRMAFGPENYSTDFFSQDS